MGTWTQLATDYWKVTKHYGRQFAVWSMRQKLGIESYPFLADGDFGNTVSKGPQDVRVARSIPEVLAILNEARDRGVPVNTCGGHHSMRGQTLSQGGIRLIRTFHMTYRFMTITPSALLQALPGKPSPRCMSTALQRRSSPPIGQRK